MNPVFTLEFSVLKSKNPSVGALGFSINLTDEIKEKIYRMEYVKPLLELIKVSIEKYGLWQTILAFMILFSVPILIWKLDVIIAAIKA